MTIIATLVHHTALLSAVNITVLSIEVGNVLGIIDKCVSVLMSPNELVNKYPATTSDTNSKKKLKQYYRMNLLILRIAFRPVRYQSAEESTRFAYQSPFGHHLFHE